MGDAQGIFHRADEALAGELRCRRFRAERCGELVGIARALSDFAIETKILDMIIAPEYQRQGIGMKIMKKIESLVRGTNIYFETERKNFPFAAKCGYKRRDGLAVFVKKG